MTTGGNRKEKRQALKTIDREEEEDAPVGRSVISSVIIVVIILTVDQEEEQSQREEFSHNQFTDVFSSATLLFCRIGETFLFPKLKLTEKIRAQRGWDGMGWDGMGWEMSDCYRKRQQLRQ